MQRTLVWGLAALWLAAWAGSFIAFQMTGPTGDGFTRGLNRLMAFLGWQLAAGFLGGLLWIIGQDMPQTALGRWLLRAPALLALLLFGALAATVAYTRFSQPAPTDHVPPAAATAPAAKPAEATN